jgi:hypothetical protein
MKKLLIVILVTICSFQFTNAQSCAKKVRYNYPSSYAYKKNCNGNYRTGYYNNNRPVVRIIVIGGPNYGYNNWNRNVNSGWNNWSNGFQQRVRINNSYSNNRYR